MTIGVFTTKARRPTTQEILMALGSKRRLWDELTRFINTNYCVREDIRFYGKNYGWAVRFRRGAKALLSMYPGKDSFAVQIILSESQVEQALDLRPGKKVRTAVDAAYPYAEGRWLFIKVETSEDLADVKRLLTIKAPPKSSQRNHDLQSFRQPR